MNRNSPAQRKEHTILRRKVASSGAYLDGGAAVRASLSLEATESNPKPLHISPPLGLMVSNGQWRVLPSRKSARPPAPSRQPRGPGHARDTSREATPFPLRGCLGGGAGEAGSQEKPSLQALPSESWSCPEPHTQPRAHPGRWVAMTSPVGGGARELKLITLQHRVDDVTDGSRGSENTNGFSNTEMVHLEKTTGASYPPNTRLC